MIDSPSLEKNQIEVRHLREPHELEAILPLLRGYQDFYEAPVVPPERNFAHFSQNLGDAPGGAIFAAYVDGQAVGFVNLYFVPSSLSARTHCCLNDLFVRPDVRSRGTARALFLAAAQYAQKRGFKSFEWITQKQNVRAQRLYDSLPQSKTEWFMYSSDLDKLSSHLS